MAVEGDKGDTGDVSLPSTPTTSTSPFKTGRTWADLVQKKKSLTKYEINVTMKDGIGSVVVPDEILQDSSPLWEDFLIGKFLAKAPHIAKIHAIVNQIWALGDKTQMIDVFVVNATTMKFKISNSATRNRVMRRGVWNLAGIPVVMTRWSPLEEEVQQEVASVPLWVHMRNVPMNMFSWKGLSFIASPVGEPDRLHPETAQCVDFKVAIVFVKADLTKELPKSMKFSLHGKETLVQYSYPWLPSKFLNCGKWCWNALIPS